ncbi:MAG: Rieske 2Fe-2S domain-containing protein [Betaproteobacteria bacterium]|nr:Rieske 2Fe-2S domain-containing protein [Betaproteobacteria bacterium]
MNQPLPPTTLWSGNSLAEVPFRAYTDVQIYARELERIFYGPHWCYAGLAAEIPKAGDFKRTFVGERQVIMVRDADGAINVVENRCAHRGMQFCQANFGNAPDFRCPYHQWNYDLKGNLIGVPYRRGVRKQGGMPADFKLEEHGLRKLQVAVHHGVVFASFDPAVPAFADYLGPDVLKYFERVFPDPAAGRELTLLGYSRQRIPGNWKLMQENIKDPYHPGLLHVFFVTFGLWRPDQQSRMVTDAQHRHACMISQRNQAAAGEATQGVSTFRENLKLQDDRILDVVTEPWWGGPTVCMTTIFPTLVVQQQVNSLSTRHIIPRGVGTFDFVWTHFGYSDDDAAMTRRRLRQANLFGPAGYVSADDGEAIECVQRGAAPHAAERTYNAMDGYGVGGADHMVTEALIRGMYDYWRRVMEV